MSDLITATTSAPTPDLTRALSRITNDKMRRQFLENVYLKVRDNKTDTSHTLLRQVVEILAPQYENEQHWLDAAKMLEEAALYPTAILDYLKVDRPGDAARCAEKSGDMRAALQLYKEARLFEHAAEVAKALHDDAQAKQLYTQAIDEYSAKKEFRHAAVAAEKAGLIEKSLQLHAAQIDQVGYADSKFMYESLVERAIRENFIDLAIELAVRGELYEKAIQIAEKNQHLDIIPRIYRNYLDSLYPKERMPVFKAYVRFLTEHGGQAALHQAYRQEVDYLQKENELLSAADLANAMHFPEARNLYEQALTQAETLADFTRAASIAAKLGLVEEAQYYISLASSLG